MSSAKGLFEGLFIFDEQHKPIVGKVRVIVTDDLKTYRSVARQLGLEHQVCQFHLRRWVGRSLYQLKKELSEEYQEILAEVQQLIDELPDWGGSRLFELWKRTPVEKSARDEPLTPSERLRNLMIRLSENWPRYRVFDWQPDVPWTNNPTGQAIFRMEMRSRTERGYKFLKGMWVALLFTGNKVIFWTDVGVGQIVWHPILRSSHCLFYNQLTKKQLTFLV